MPQRASEHVLTPVQRQVLRLLTENYPKPLMMSDVRERLGMQIAPREALLALADSGLVRAAMRGDDRLWRATRAGTLTIAACGGACEEDNAGNDDGQGRPEPGA